MTDENEVVGTLLIVDDEPNILTALMRLFRRDGYRLLSASSGHETLSLLAANEVGARILAVADDYDELQLGSITQKRRSPEHAALMIRDGARARYDPFVVGIFLKIMGMTVVDVAAGAERRVVSAMLKVKTQLARDVVGQDGAMLLSKGYVLDEKLIQQLQKYEEKTG